MNRSIQARLAKLEDRTGSHADRITVIARPLVAPGPDGPVRTDDCLVSVIGSRERFSSCDFANEEALWAAVSACHERVHGTAVARGGNHAA